MRARVRQSGLLRLVTGFFALPAFLSVFASPVGALGGNDSILLTIEKFREAVVVIQAENAGVVSPEGQGLAVVSYVRQGSGIVIDPRGLVVTNAHIAARSGRLRVIFGDGTTYAGTVVMAPPGEDLAFVRVAADRPLPSVRLADAASIKLGMTVYTIGGSEILRGTISEGTITGVGERAPDSGTGPSEPQFIKIDFNVYQGDSGGPLIDRSGRLVGLILAGGTRGSRICLASPSNVIEKYYRQCVGR